MEKILTISKLSGDGFLVKVEGKEYGFSHCETFTDFIGAKVMDALWPKGDVAIDSCTLTIKTGKREEFER